MKIEENNVKCGEIMIFDHKFYQSTKFLPNFVSTVGFCPKSMSREWGFQMKKLVGGWLLVKVIPE